MTAAAFPEWKLAYRIDEAASAIGVSRSTIYELVALGELELGKVAGRSVIRREQLEAYFARAYQPATTPRSRHAA